MKSELTTEFLECFANLPERVKQTARKNYQLWKENPYHPSLEFKKLNTKEPDILKITKVYKTKNHLISYEKTNF